MPCYGFNCVGSVGTQYRPLSQKRSESAERRNAEQCSALRAYTPDLTALAGDAPRHTQDPLRGRQDAPTLRPCCRGGPCGRSSVKTPCGRGSPAGCRAMDSVVPGRVRQNVRPLIFRKKRLRYFLCHDFSALPVRAWFFCSLFQGLIPSFFASTVPLSH